MTAQRVFELLTAFNQSIDARTTYLRQLFSNNAWPTGFNENSDVKQLYSFYHDQVLDFVLDKLNGATFPVASSTNNDEYEAYLTLIDLLNFVQDRWSYLLGVDAAMTPNGDAELLHRTLETLTRLFSASSGATTADSAAAIHFRSLCAETLTAIMINVDAFSSEPTIGAQVIALLLACLLERELPPSPLFTSLSSSSLSTSTPTPTMTGPPSSTTSATATATTAIAAITTNSNTAATTKPRQLRAACCRCLLEIERNYVGILCNELSSICNHVRTF